MKLCDLAGEFGTGFDGANVEITGLTSDSRTVEPGFLFAAHAGTKGHGESFVADAERRGARYVCVLALALPTGTGPRGGLDLILTRGTTRGRIAAEPRGSGGFGYDPIFEPRSEPPGGRTLGLWTPAEKHAISHRARAARRMAARLAQLGY